MAAFQWDESFRVHHDAIDHDHQIACGIFGDMEAALDDLGRSGVALRALTLVRDLIAFMHRHFETENDVMMTLPIGVYDDHINRHIKAHEDFLLKLKALEQLIVMGGNHTDLLLVERQGLLALLTDLLELDGELVGHLVHEGMHRPLAVNG